MADIRRRLAAAEAALAASQQPTSSGDSLEARLTRGAEMFDHLVNGGPSPAGMTLEEAADGRWLLEKVQQAQSLMNHPPDDAVTTAEPDSAVAVADDDQADASTPLPARPIVEDDIIDDPFGPGAYGAPPPPRTPGRPRF
jgi:hypothetical protein